MLKLNVPLLEQISFKKLFLKVAFTCRGPVSTKLERTNYGQRHSIPTPSNRTVNLVLRRRMVGYDIAYMH